MRKQILIAFGVLSLTGAAAFGLVQSSFTDVPAGHWAQEAVDYASKAGLVQGYPDQTFKGNKTLTRYEAAMIFYRLQKSGAMGNMSAEGQAAMTAGMGDVQTELEDIKAKLDEADTAAQDQSARIDALEAATPGEPAAAPDTTDLEARLQALEDKAAEPAAEPAAPDNTALEDRLQALEDKAAEPAAAPAAPDNTALEARLKALEDKAAEPAAAPEAGVSPEDVKALEDRIAELEAAPAPEAPAAVAGADAAKVTALEEKLAALEKKVADQPAPVAGADAAKVTALDDRVTKLEGQVTALSSEVGTLKAAKPVEPVVTTPTVTPEPVVTTPEVTPPVVETPAPRKPNLYVGAGANFGVVPSGGSLGVSGVVGFKRLIGPFGFRVAADYNLATRFLAVEPNVMFELNPDGFFDPYIGIGGGGVFGSPNSAFVGGAAGLGLNFTPNLGLFVEANPRFTFGAPTNQFGVNLRAGLRFAF